MVKRKYWQADLLNIVDEPLFLSLLKYRMREDRWPDKDGNLISSHIEGSDLHAPVIDLDIPHKYLRSTSDGHGHLYIDKPMSRIRMFALLTGLYLGGVIEMGNFWWTLRRGATFVRRPGVYKSPSEKKFRYHYGMFLRLKEDS